MPGEPVMGVMRVAQLGIGEACVEEAEHCADGSVEARPARCERSVHGIVADDEDADRKPALHCGQRECEWQAGPAQLEDEHAVKVDRQPRPRNCDSQRKADQALNAAVGHGVARGRHRGRYERRSHAAAYRPPDALRKRASDHASGKKNSRRCSPMRAGRRVLASMQHQLDCTSASTSSPRRITVR